MKIPKHIGVGFLVSFIGSLPLGYLNVVGLAIYASGFDLLFWYMLGVVSVEAITVFLTLIFAERLAKRQRLMRFIEGFSVLFMFVLAIIFYLGASGDKAHFEAVHVGTMASAYLLGVSLSAVNFLQLPFWTGWNLYLVNKKYVEPTSGNRAAYVVGTAVGTFCGMLAFIFLLARLQEKYFAGGVMYLLALGFAVIGAIQAWKYYRKYHGAKQLPYL